MAKLAQSFFGLFETDKWPPRWYCGEWSDFHGWVYIVSDLAIWLAYSIIPFLLLYFMMKRRHKVPFVRVFWLFILFILTCGATHFMDAVLFWQPAYRFSALLLAITAIVSWVAVYGLYRVLPKALTLRTPKELELVVDERTRELRIAKDNLTKQNIQLKDYTDITSHNLRAPVSNIVSLTSLYEGSSDQEEKDEFISKIKVVSDRLMNTLEELYEVARIRDPQELTTEKVSFESVLKDVLEEVSSDIEQTQAEISYDFSACSSFDYAKPYLHNIMANLLTNAIKYRHPQRTPKIAIWTEQRDEQLLLKVKDNGRGLNLARYGKNLFRLHKTFNKNQDARGAGLFIVKNQVENFGGSIHMESTEGEGSTMVVNFFHQDSVAHI